MKTVVKAIIVRYSFMFTLAILYYISLYNANLIYFGLTLFFVFFFTKQKSAHLYWKYLVMYTNIVIFSR
jgi:hypothetical protein